MSHLVIVGASSGIGLEIQPFLNGRVSVQPRRANDCEYDDATALLFCQRARGFDADEFDVSLTRTQLLIEDYAQHARHLRSIVVMASVAAVAVEEEQPVDYHMAKAALVQMVRYYAVTLGPKNIVVNAIIPGLTIKQPARAFYDAHPAFEDQYRRITPLGRLGSVEDIAPWVNLLISEHGYMTGQTITIDGGIGLHSAWALARMITPELKDVPVTQRAGEQRFVEAYEAALMKMEARRDNK